MTIMMLGAMTNETDIRGGRHCVFRDARPLGIRRQISMKDI